MQLQDDGLLKTQAFIDGSWHDADNGSTTPVLNPATGETLAQVARCGREETRRAIAAAHRAQLDWRQRTADERSAVTAPAIHELMLTPSRRPVPDHHYRTGQNRWRNRAGKSNPAPATCDGLPRKRGVYMGTLSQARARTSACSPSNSLSGWLPASHPGISPMPCWRAKLGPALASRMHRGMQTSQRDAPVRAGHGGIVRCARASRRAWSTYCAGTPSAIGAELTSNPLVRKLTFTGSTEVGNNAHAAMRRDGQAHFNGTGR